MSAFKRPEEGYGPICKAGSPAFIFNSLVTMLLSGIVVGRCLAPRTSRCMLAVFLPSLLAAVHLGLFEGGLLVVSSLMFLVHLSSISTGRKGRCRKYFMQ